MNYPNSLNKLIESFKNLPGIGERTAERLAFSILCLDEETVELFSRSLTDVKTKIKRCSICNNLTEYDICEICSNEGRNKDLIFVVEDSKSVFLFEKLGTFDGYYHVLGGLISPLDGINPEDINVDKLIKRIDDNKYKEIIFALKPSIEGETTTLYITKLLSGKDIKISRIARGVPLGADMEYVDSLTLEMALEDRKTVY